MGVREPDQSQNESDSSSAENSTPALKPRKSDRGKKRWICTQGCGKRSSKCPHPKVLEHFPSAKEEAQKAAADRERVFLAEKRERKRQEWLAQDLKQIKNSRPDWQNDEAGWEGVVVPVEWDRQQHCKATYALRRWNQGAHAFWHSFEMRGFRGEGLKSRTWLRARLAQVQLKEKQCLKDDYITEEEDELLDLVHANQERAEKFLRELNAPDSECDTMNVHKYGWGDPDGHVAEYWTQMEQQELADVEEQNATLAWINSDVGATTAFGQNTGVTSGAVLQWVHPDKRDWSNNCEQQHLDLHDFLSDFVCNVCGMDSQGMALCCPDCEFTACNSCASEQNQKKYEDQWSDY